MRNLTEMTVLMAGVTIVAPLPVWIIVTLLSPWIG
jgi:hypothetical protein